MMLNNSIYPGNLLQIPVVDKVGSGDCFMAGLIYGLGNDLPPKEIINFAAAAAVGKLQEKGDSTSQDLASIQSKISYYE
jgi:2-dehydro-3-deoxygluconokinase